jgi:hypothetical protein
MKQNGDMWGVTCNTVHLVHPAMLNLRKYFVICFCNTILANAIHFKFFRDDQSFTLYDFSRNLAHDHGLQQFRVESSGRGNLFIGEIAASN